MDRQQRLRIAVQKSGRLTDASLDLLQRCGLKFSRGKDQLMCYGENMPLDVLFVRDDDIPDLVQEDVCDLGLVGLNVLEEKRLAMLARGTEPRIEVLQKLDFGHCRLSLAVPEGLAYDGSLLASPACASRPPTRTCSPLPEGQWHQGRNRHAVGRGRDRAAPGPRGPDLRPGVDRLDAARQSPARGAHDPRRARWCLIRTPVTLPEIKEDWMRAPAAAHRWRAAGEGEQVHHAACAAVGAAADREAAAGQRIAHDHSARRLGDKVAVHAVCRETVFWETLESLKAAGASAVLVLPVEKMLA